MTERDIKGLEATLKEGDYWAKKPEGQLRKRTKKNYKIPEPSDDDEEDDDNDAVGEDDMDEPTLPPPPKIKLRQTATSDGKLSKPILVVTPAATGPLKSLEQKEADVDPGDDEEDEEDDEDEDLSELNSDDEDQPDETNPDEDGEGDGEEDDVDGGDDMDGEDGDIDLDSDGMTPGSGAATPDLAKMTKRQRRDDEGFMALDMAPQV
jgi:Ino eighty subunit 2